MAQYPLNESIWPWHSVFFGPFLSGCFFPPNYRAHNHAQENPLLVLFMLAQKCLWTLRVQKWEAVELLKMVFLQTLTTNGMS
jgi:hypothetical protein